MLIPHQIGWETQYKTMQQKMKAQSIQILRLDDGLLYELITTAHTQQIID
jgi:hypothetical protein